MLAAGNPFKKSVTLTVVSALSLVVILGLCLLVFTQIHRSQQSTYDFFNEANITKTELMAAQMEGGVKWKKADKISSIYKNLIDTKKSNLSAVYVFHEKAGKLVEENSEHFTPFNFNEFLDQHPNIKSLQEGNVFDTSDNLIIFRIVNDTKKNKPLGGMLMVWSKKAVNDAIAEMTFMQAILSLGILIALLVAMVLLLSRIVIKPLKSSIDVMSALASGDYKVDIPYSDRENEVGVMAKALEVFKKNAIEKEETEKAAQEAEKRMQEERKAEMNDMSNQFEEQVLGIVEHLGASIAHMEQTFGDLSSLAQNTEQQAGSAAKFSQSAYGNVQTVAAASEELNSSVKEIISQVTRASDLTRKANTQAGETNKIVETMQASTNKIGEVVQLIKDIAEQTNLLALNATIESARAGEAGKGFAVVANEVKSLAMETGNATEEIAERVEEIQSISEQSAQAISEISAAIVEINEVITAVTSASEQQGAATQEISRGAQEAATGTNHVSDSIASVNKAAVDTENLAQETSKVLQDISEKSEALKESVNDFIRNIRVA